MTSRFSPAAVAVFEFFFRPWMKHRLGELLVTGIPDRLPTDRPILLAANHVSWWDGFIAREVQKQLRPGGAMYSVMSEPGLSRRPFLRLMGVTGIYPRSSRNLRRAIRHLEAIPRSVPGATILFFPQGRIWPSHRRPLGFEPGIALFADRLGAAIVPVAIHIEPLNRMAPTVFVSLGPTLESPVAVRDIEHAVEVELDRILAFVATFGEDAARLWPQPTNRLPAVPALPAANPS